MENSKPLIKPEKDKIQNRRSSPRIESCIPAVLIDKTTMSYGTIMDFSEEGLRLNIPFAIELNNEVELIIKPKNDPLAKPLHVKLEVKHCREESSQSFAIGGQLNNCFDGLKTLLHSYTQKQPGSSLKDRLGYILA